MPSSTEKPAAAATHELAAIMFSDVVGYTALMGRDEQKASKPSPTIVIICAQCCRNSTGG